MPEDQGGGNLKKIVAHAYSLSFLGDRQEDGGVDVAKHHCQKREREREGNRKTKQCLALWKGTTVVDKSAALVAAQEEPPFSRSPYISSLRIGKSWTWLCPFLPPGTHGPLLNEGLS